MFIFEYEKGQRVRDHLPLQQGLRLFSSSACFVLMLTSQRPSSITTRIKTRHQLYTSDSCRSETIFHYNKD